MEKQVFYERANCSHVIDTASISLGSEPSLGIGRQDNLVGIAFAC